MAEFRLTYNPFTVETALSVRVNDRWVPVNEESGLLRIAKMRMQRWLAPASERFYFDELREAAGEDDIEIRFSGTKEDMEDLQRAASAYSRAHEDVRISVRAMCDVEQNSSGAKLKQLRELLRRADASDFKALLPKSIWEYLQHCTNPPSEKAVYIPLLDWQNWEDAFFSPGSWQMVCMTLPCDQLRGKEARQRLRAFAKWLEALRDRRFERERFLFICHCRSSGAYSESDVKKVFMQYGMQDMNYALLTDSELAELDDLSGEARSAALADARQSVRAFSSRYAEQYRLRKMHEIVRGIFRDQGFARGPRLSRMIDDVLRGEASATKDIPDAVVIEAIEWVGEFMDSIEHLLDIDATEPET